MAKEFTKIQQKEIKNKFKKFSLENPDMKINPEICAKNFAKIISNSNSEEGKHYERNYVPIKQMTADKKVFDAYNRFYKVTLKNALYFIGSVYIGNKKDIEMDFDYYKKYENFMREMFTEYIKPNINLDVELKDYRFGRLDDNQLEDISKSFDKLNREWAYKSPLKELQVNEKEYYFNDLKDQMNILPVKNTTFDKMELAKGTAVVYKLAEEQYNRRGRLSKIFNPYAWGEAWTLHKSKNYIQELREEDDKKKVSFENFVKDSANEPFTSTLDFDTVMEQIKGVIDTSNDLPKGMENQDVMNLTDNDIYRELYDEELEVEEVDANERNNDFIEDEIDTTQRNNNEIEIDQ